MRKTKKILLTLTSLSIPFAAGISLASCGSKESFNEFAKDFVLGASGRENYKKDTKTLDLSKSKITNIPQGAFSHKALSELLIKAVSPNNFSSEWSAPAGIIDIVSKTINIEKIILPETLEKIEEGAFIGLGLKEVQFAISSSKLKTIEKEAFANNKLSSLVLPSSVNEIKEKAFYNNELTSLNLNQLKELKKLSVGVFAKNKLVNIDLENINTIEESALALNNFINLEFHSSLTNVSEKLFFFFGKETVAETSLKILNVKLKEYLKNALKANTNLNFKIIN